MPRFAPEKGGQKDLRRAFFQLDRDLSSRYQ